MTPKQHTPIQLALDGYSLTVQRYRQIVEQLPASARPAPLDRFRHRGNICAIRRRTEEVIKATTRLQKAAHAPQSLPARRVTIDTAKTGQQIPGANPTAANSDSSVKPNGNDADDTDTGRAQEPDTVLVQSADTARPADAHIAAENGGMSSAQFFTYAEVQLLIRVA
ncbi:hypothetical protein FN846DRAFT_890930 [Sphaerosporella brunnea]|uniref:Uncharacterized protein n=1 Tax=Sphaerosporella brunnea TaxID=1250544 RepID=A0A5J5EV06_9PEZI|nr:hypothetical protein FN846DRAFT_890930 [Sphaerosporella brunnea]